MNLRQVYCQLGKILVIIGLSMVFPMLMALYDRDPTAGAFAAGLIITTAAGLVTYMVFRGESGLSIRDGFLLVTLSWVVASLFGSIPMVMAGVFASPLDAVFETVSGFTATGITILEDVEAMPRSILLWRSLSQWLGGMGIVVLFVALLSGIGHGGMLLFNAELTGPVKEKIRPRITDSAKSLWLIYLGLTVISIVAYLASGMTLFDAINHGFTTISTGGYSTRTDGFARSPGLVVVIATILMFVSGLSFARIYMVFTKKTLTPLTSNAEARLYGGIVAFWSLLLFVDRVRESQAPLWDDFLHSIFHVVSIITTTGFIGSDIESWSPFSQSLIMILILTGSCAGSTSGGLKLQRIVILMKQTKFELLRLLHPRMVTAVKVNNIPLQTSVVTNVAIFVFLYMLIIFISSVVASFFGLAYTEAFTTAVTCLGNGGASLGVYGDGSFAGMPPGLKAYYGIIMIIGRLEIYTLLVLLIPFQVKRVS